MRFSIWSFIRMLEMWFLTVFGLMWSSPAISALSLPFAISRSTSVSRSESSGPRAAVSGSMPEARIRCNTFDAMCGEISASPTDAARIGDREHHDASQGREAGDLARRLDAVHPGHVQIHNDDVGREFEDEAQRRRAVGGFGDDLDALFLQKVAQTGPKEVVVVHEHHPEQIGREGLGWTCRLSRHSPYCQGDLPPCLIRVDGDRHDTASPGACLPDR